MSTHLERIRLINGKILVRVKPGSQKNEIVSVSKDFIKINIKAHPENNKANIELIKFLKRTTKKNVKIIVGFTKKEKLLEIS